MEVLTHCPICGKNCSLKSPRCSNGRNIARRQKEKLAYEQVDDSPDYGQHSHGYDPEGLADPDAHNYPADHTPRQQPKVRKRNFDLDSDEDFENEGEKKEASEVKAEAVVPQKAPRCPGCRMGCDLNDPQCGKGYALHKDWLEGRELSAWRGQGGMRRRGPGGPGGSGGRAGNLMRLRFLLDMSSRKVGKQTECLEKGQFLEMLYKQGHFMKFTVLGEKARMDPARLKALLPELEREGLIEIDWDAVMLTDEGEAAAVAASMEADEVVARAFGNLEPDEQVQLGNLLHKLLGSFR